MPDSTASLPEPSASFQDRKAKILSQLAVPDADYTDASPKGSVDEGIRPLMHDINAAAGFVTTSSCAGRVSVFLEGRKAPSAAAATSNVTTEPQDVGQESTQVTDGPNERLAGVGGKGGGGTWLYVSHDPHYKPSEAADSPSGTYWIDLFDLRQSEDQSTLAADKSAALDGNQTRLIHFKFEPMILHVLTASHTHAQLLLRCALHAGFRESGAVSLLSSNSDDPTASAMPMVAVRTMGLSFESLIGQETADGQRQILVAPAYLDILMKIANERFEENTKRIARFAAAFADEMTPKIKKAPDGGDWEDAAARRERMKADGLRRKAEMAKLKEAQSPSVADNDQEDMYVQDMDA